MRTFLVLAICLLSFNTFSQGEDFDEDDTLELYVEYLILDEIKWTSQEFIPAEENKEWDVFTKIMYNPYVNGDALDSILKWRESKGYAPLVFNWQKQDTRMRDGMFYIAMDISKEEKSKVTMGRFEDLFPDCDCSNAIAIEVLDDSLTTKNNVPLKNYLLNDKIKRVELYYYQVRPRDHLDDPEEHLMIKIKKRFRLLSTEYPIY
jgi:hypothetical protein